MAKIPTYKEIQAAVKSKYGFVPKSCWIADVKEKMGLPVKRSHRRKGERMHPCPVTKQKYIEVAIRGAKVNTPQKKSYSKSPHNKIGLQGQFLIFITANIVLAWGTRFVLYF